MKKKILIILLFGCVTADYLLTHYVATADQKPQCALVKTVKTGLSASKQTHKLTRVTKHRAIRMHRA